MEEAPFSFKLGIFILFIIIFVAAFIYLCKRFKLGEKLGIIKKRREERYWVENGEHPG
jgi:hypothetical protein